MNEKKYTVVQNSMFNMIGTLVYYVCQWLMTMAVVRLSTDGNIGDLQLSMTVTNTFYTLSNYNMRAFQISDLRNEYLPGHYVAVRLLTCGASFVLCVGYAMLWRYPLRSVLCIALYMIYRLNEAVADVLHAIDQKHARMDHVMVSYTARGIMMLLAFIALIMLTGDLLLAVSAMAVITFAVVLFYDIRCTRRYDSIRPLFEWRRMKGILTACFPAMLGTFCFTSIVSIPRQNLGRVMGQDLLGYYATVATPLVFVQVLINSLMNPTLSVISQARQDKDHKRLMGLTGRMLLIVFGVGAASLAGIAALGRPVMRLLYGEKILPYISLMYAVIGCTVLYAASSVGFNLLIIFRKMYTYLFICAAALAASVTLSTPMIRSFGANGVSYSVMIAYLFAAVASFSVVLSQVRGWRKGA
ncbi:MAG: lipopolysaccharide biosynthesis protein [Clostridia bacterium]|nr:lipopolysaccharide biosynthesis protein [Clostridia bacterium]